MRTVTVPLPILVFVISTRAALAAGIAFLVGDRLSQDRRRSVGKALLAIGAATTIPAVATMVRVRKAARLGSPIHHDRRLVGATRYPRKGDDIL